MCRSADALFVRASVPEGPGLDRSAVSSRWLAHAACHLVCPAVSGIVRKFCLGLTNAGQALPQDRRRRQSLSQLAPPSKIAAPAHPVILNKNSSSNQTSISLTTAFRRAPGPHSITHQGELRPWAWQTAEPRTKAKVWTRMGRQAGFCNRPPEARPPPWRTRCLWCSRSASFPQSIPPRI